MKQRVLILGGGFGGAYCAQALERAARDIDVETLLIDRNNYFVFHPLLVEAGTGSLHPRDAVVSIRSFLRSTRFRMAEVLGVDLERRQVTCRTVGSDVPEAIDWDHLVLALGSVTRLPEVPGLREYGYELKGLSDAVALRDHAITMLEAADATADHERRRSFLHFVVVGGNFTGAEVAGEFHQFLRNASRRYPGLRPGDCRVTLIEIADRILGAVEPDLSEYATRSMRRRGIDVRLQTSVVAIERDTVRLSTGEALPASTVIWCAGIAPSPLVRKISVPVDERGYILCERDLSVRGFDRVWAIGDCAVNPGPDGVPYPATAQHAVREGVHLARSLARVLSGRAALPFEYASRGAVAALGCRTGVARVLGVKLSGFPAWFLWRTVYLLKMPGLARKARVALDWTADLFFPRDYVQLGVHRSEPKDHHRGV